MNADLHGEQSAILPLLSGEGRGEGLLGSIIIRMHETVQRPDDKPFVPSSLLRPKIWVMTRPKGGTPNEEFLASEHLKWHASAAPITHPMRTVSLLLAYFLSNTLAPGQSTLIPRGSVWKYQRSEAPPNWTQSNFDDSAWYAGPAQLGFGEGDEQTTVYEEDPAFSPTTVYYRHAFVVSNPSEINVLTVRLVAFRGRLGVGPWYCLFSYFAFRTKLPLPAYRSNVTRDRELPSATVLLCKPGSCSYLLSRAAPSALYPGPWAAQVTSFSRPRIFVSSVLLLPFQRLQQNLISDIAWAVPSTLHVGLWALDLTPAQDPWSTGTAPLMRA
jgi:hypothetical protein